MNIDIFKWKLTIFYPIIKILSFPFKFKKTYYLDGLQIKVHNEVDNVTRFLLYTKQYEKAERKLINFFDDNVPLIEAGGGIGVTGMLSRKKIKDIVILEPIKKNFNLIIENFKVNNLFDKKLHIINSALSDKKGYQNFYEKEFNIASSLDDHDENRTYQFKTLKKTQVQAFTINELITKFSFKNIQLNLDLEGYEYNIIKNNNQWLEKCENLLVEYHISLSLVDECNKILKKNNFKIFDKNQNTFFYKKET
jgi:FkbM family methyltransferase